MLKDTLQASERLKAGGFDEEHARAIIDVLMDSGEEFATKKDLELLEERLKNYFGGQIRLWVGGIGGLIALLMTLFEFIN